jgi:hypothetical protein
MTEAGVHAALTWLEIGFAVAALVALLFITAPYGRHERSGWGPTIPNVVGWVVMESPAVVGFAAVFLAGDSAGETVPLLFGAVWMTHYVHRTFIFPFRVRTGGKQMPVVIAALAFTFNVLNAYVVARWISELGSYEPSWLRDPRFIVGVTLFAAGLIINVKADSMLIALRRPGETAYRIPRGWLFDYVACPNYLGEIIEWTGFAIATWSLPGLAFALFTAANVGPRAFANWRWYRKTFPEYPADRKALIPFVA